MKVTNLSNFCRIFELPDTFPTDYCFGGGHPCTFTLVDWFNPVPGEVTPLTEDGFDKISWNDGRCNLDTEGLEFLRSKLKAALLEKKYIKPGKRYVVITEYGDSFMVGGDDFAQKLNAENQRLRNLAESHRG